MIQLDQYFSRSLHLLTSTRWVVERMVKEGSWLLATNPQNELRRLAGQQSVALTDCCRFRYHAMVLFFFGSQQKANEEASNKRLQGLKRRAEDHLPDLRPKGGSLCTNVSKSNTCEYFIMALQCPCNFFSTGKN